MTGQRNLTGTLPERAASRESLATPAALGHFIDLARAALAGPQDGV